MAMTMTAANAGGPPANAVMAAARTRFQRAMAEVRFDDRRWAARFGPADEASYARVLLAAPPAEAPDDTAERLARIRQLTLDPVYQLK
jgi:hypothetical protein